MVSGPVTHPAPVWCNHVAEVLCSDIEPGTFSGKTILVVLTGAPGRRRVLNRVIRSGCRVVMYQTEYNWATALLPNTEDWIVGPLEDLDAAIEAVHSWLLKEEPKPVHVTVPYEEAAHLEPTGKSEETLLEIDDKEGSTEREIHGVLCYDEYGLHLASVIAESLGLPFMTPHIVETLRNKFHFRQKCKEGGIPYPRFMRVAKQYDEKQLADIMDREQVRFPVVAKPSACAGSFAVLKAHNMPELLEAVSSYYTGLPTYLDSVGLGPTSACAMGGMVVEEMMRGEEVDIDCVVHKGELLFACVSDNHDPCSPLHATSFVERGGRCPSTLPLSQQEALFQMAAAIFKLWGNQLSGVFHLEAFSTAQGPVPIELNARIGGAETFTNIKAVWGVDLAEQALRCALGLPPQLPTLIDAVNPVQKPVIVSLPASSSRSAISVASSIDACKEQDDSTDDENVMGEAAHEHDVALDDMWARPSAENSKRPSCERGMQPSCPQGPLVCVSDVTQRMQEIALTDSSNPVAKPKPRCENGDGHVHAVEIHAVATWRLPVGDDLEDGASLASCHAHLVHDAASSHGELGYDSYADSPDVTPPSSVIFAPDVCAAQECAFVAHATSTRHDPSPLQCATFPSPHIPESVSITSDPAPCKHAVQQEVENQTQEMGRPVLMTGSYTRCAHPLYHVHSVNFVPDWEGLGIVDVLDLKPGAQQHPAYVDVQMYYKPGNLVRLPPLGFSALGWMVARGMDPQHAEHQMHALMDLVDIQLHKP